MGKPKRRFVPKGVSGGWRIWDSKLERFWGDMYELQPDQLVDELNGAKNPVVITKLTKNARKLKR